MPNTPVGIANPLLEERNGAAVAAAGPAMAELRENDNTGRDNYMGIVGSGGGGGGLMAQGLFRRCILPGNNTVWGHLEQ